MQLDMLWHDIDEGRIHANTTSANSWYSHIKKVKDGVYLSLNWIQELTDAYEDLEDMANNNTQNV